MCGKDDRPVHTGRCFVGAFLGGAFFVVLFFAGAAFVGVFAGATVLVLGPLRDSAAVSVISPLYSRR